MSTPATEGSPSSTRRSWLGTGLLILVLPIAVCLMLLAFLTPALNSGPEDLPLAVAGPASAVEQITDALEERPPPAPSRSPSTTTPSRLSRPWPIERPSVP